MELKIISLYLLNVIIAFNKNDFFNYIKYLFILAIIFFSLILFLNFLPKIGFDKYFLIDNSIGNSTYNGYPYKIPMYLIFILIAFINIYIAKKISKFKFNNIKSDKNIKFNNYISYFLVILISFILIPIIDIPNSNYSFNKLSWDGQNIKYWILLLQEGKLPYKDFWWPYYGSFIFYYNDILSYLSKYLYSLIGVLIVYLSIIKIFNQKIATIWLFLFYLCYISGYYFNLARYFQVAVVIFIFFILNINNFYKYIFQIYLFVVIFIDPSIFFLGFFSITFPLALYLIFYLINPNLISIYNFNILKNFILNNFKYATISTIVIMLLLFFSNNSFNELINKFLDIGNIPEFTTQPVPLNYLKYSLNDEYVIGILGLILIPLLFTKIFNDFSFLKKLSLIALLNSVLLLSIKHYLRGPLGIEIAATGVVLITLILSVYLSKLNNKIIIISIIGFTIFNFNFIIKTIDLKFNSINNLLNTNFIDRNNKQIKIKSDYHYKKLAQIPNYQNSNFFIFGDDPILYLLTSNPRPPHSAMYNASTKLSQKDLIEFINNNDIKTIAISKENFDFDGFSYLIRNRYLSNFILSNYKYSHETNDFYIYKPGFGLIDTNIKVFGNNIYLGRIPNHFSISKPTLIFIPTIKDKNYEIDVVVNNVPLKIYFRTSEFLSSKSIKIPLDLLWFCYDKNNCNLSNFASKSGKIFIKY